jgi:type I restriction enzyme, S subunit
VRQENIWRTILRRTPETWTPVPMKKVLARNDGGVWGDDPVDGEGIPVLRSTDITLDGAWKLSDPALRRLSQHDHQATRLEVGDILVVKSSGSEEHIGKSAMVDEDIAALGASFSNFTQRLRPNDPSSSRYLWYLLNSSFAREQFAWLGTTTTGLRNLSAGLIGSLWHPGASVTEQQLIANFLDGETARIDAILQARKQLADCVSERFKAYAANQLLQGVDPTSARSADLPGGWRLARLATLVKLQRGHDLPEQARRHGKVPVISSGGLSGFHDEPAAMGPGVVTGRYGTVGEVFWIEGPYWPLNTSLYVADFRGSDPRWVYHLLRVTPLNVDAEKSAVTGINRNVVGQLRLPVPPVDEQRRLALLLDHAEQQVIAVRAVITHHVALLKDRRQAVITAAVTGQTKVPEKAV